MSVNQEVKDVKSINIKNFITALEHMHPDISSVVDPVYALYTKEYIDDPNTWTGTQPVLDLFTRYKEFVNVKHPSVIFDVGIKTSKLRAIGKLENLVRFVGRPRVAFSQIPNYNKHFNNIFDMEVHNLTGSSATLIVNYIPRKENIWTYEQCWWNRGIIASIPQLWNLPNAEYKEVLCFYTPEKIAQSTGLNIHTQGTDLFIDDKKIGEKVLLKKDMVTTKHLPFRLTKKSDRPKLFGSEYEMFDASVHTNEPSGYLITEDVELEDKLLLEKGVIIGAPYCRYEFTWKNKNFFKNLYDLTIGKFKELKKTSFALEEQLNYSQQQFFQIENLLNKEKELTAELTEHKEHLEEMVEKRTDQYKSEKERAENALDELKAAQDQIIKAEVSAAEKAEQLRTSEILSGGIAHELGNALTGANQLLDHVLNYKGDKSMVQVIYDQISQFASVIKKLTKDYNVPNEVISSEIIPGLMEIVNIIDPSQNNKKNKKPLEKVLETVKMGVERSLRIKEQFKDYSLLQRQVKGTTPVNMRDLLNSVIDSCSPQLEQYDITYLVHAIEENYTMIGDRDQLYSVLSNPVLNSIYAVRDTETRKIDLTLESEKFNGDTFLKYIVEDTGCGIPQDKQKRIFDPLFSTKGVEGTGLGLSIVKRIVDLYDGVIEFDSKEDEGSKFTFYLKQ